MKSLKRNSRPHTLLQEDAHIAGLRTGASDDDFPQNDQSSSQNLRPSPQPAETEELSPAPKINRHAPNFASPSSRDPIAGSKRVPGGLDQIDRTPSLRPDPGDASLEKTLPDASQNFDQCPEPTGNKCVTTSSNNARTSRQKCVTCVTNPGDAWRPKNPPHARPLALWRAWPHPGPRPLIPPPPGRLYKGRA